MSGAWLPLFHPFGGLLDRFGWAMSRAGARENAALEDYKINLVETEKVDQFAVIHSQNRRFTVKTKIS